MYSGEEESTTFSECSDNDLLISETLFLNRNHEIEDKKFKHNTSTRTTNSTDIYLNIEQDKTPPLLDRPLIRRGRMESNTLARSLEQVNEDEFSALKEQTQEYMQNMPPQSQISSGKSLNYRSLAPVAENPQRQMEAPGIQPLTIQNLSSLNQPTRPTPLSQTTPQTHQQYSAYKSILDSKVSSALQRGPRTSMATGRRVSTAGSSEKGHGAGSSMTIASDVLQHVSFEGKVSFEAQGELAKSRSMRFRKPPRIEIFDILTAKPVDLRLQAFSPNPPKRNTREAMRPEKYLGMHTHGSRTSRDFLNEENQSENSSTERGVSDVAANKLYKAPTTQAEQTRAKSLTNSPISNGKTSSSLRTSPKTAHWTSIAFSQTMSNSAKSSLSGSSMSARTDRSQSAHGPLSQTERPEFNTRVRLMRPYTSKRLAVSELQHPKERYELPKKHDFRPVQKAKTMGLPEFETSIEKDPTSVKFLTNTMPIFHSPVYIPVEFRDVENLQWSHPIGYRPKWPKELYLPHNKWPDRFAGYSRYRGQWRDPHDAFLERVEGTLNSHWEQNESPSILLSKQRF